MRSWLLLLVCGLAGVARAQEPQPPATWPHLAALTPPVAWEVEARPGAPERTRWSAEVTVQGLGDANGPTGTTRVARLVDAKGTELDLALPPLPESGPFAWAVRSGAAVRLDVFRRKDGPRQGTAVALRELPSGRLLLFYDDGVLPPCGVEDMDDVTATLTPLPPREGPAEDAWVATTLRLDRGNDTVTLRDDDPAAPLGRSGLVARVVRARIHTGGERIGAWLVWRPAE